MEIWGVNMKIGKIRKQVRKNKTPLLITAQSHLVRKINLNKRDASNTKTRHINSSSTAWQPHFFTLMSVGLIPLLLSISRVYFSTWTA